MSKPNLFRPTKNTILQKKAEPTFVPPPERDKILLPSQRTALEIKQDEQKLESSHLIIALQAQEELRNRSFEGVDSEKLSKIAVQQSEEYRKFKEAANAGFQQAPATQVLIQLNTLLQNLPPMPENFIEV